MAGDSKEPEPPAESEESPKTFWGWINKTDLIWVISGGLLGGWLMPIVKRFLQSKSAFDNSLQFPGEMDAWFLSALLGAICAGVVVYTFSYTGDNKRRQTFFVALLAGLTFPGFMSNALNIREEIDDQKKAFEQAEIIVPTDDSTPEQKEKAVDAAGTAITTALGEVSAKSLDDQEQQAAKVKTEQLAIKLADTVKKVEPQQTAENTVDIATKVERQLENVIKTAKEKGYKEISDSPIVKGALEDTRKEKREAQSQVK